MRSLAAVLIMGLALLLAGCGQSTTTSNASQGGVFDFEGNWAAILDGGERIVVTVAEVDRGDYQAAVTIYPAGGGEPALYLYKHGAMTSGSLAWTDGTWVRFTLATKDWADGIRLARRPESDEMMLERTKPGADARPLPVRWCPPGQDIDWDSL